MSYVLVIYVYRKVLQRIKWNRISFYLLYSDSANVFSNSFDVGKDQDNEEIGYLTKNPFERSDIPNFAHKLGTLWLDLKQLLIGAYLKTSS